MKPPTIKPISKNLVGCNEHEKTAGTSRKIIEKMRAQRETGHDPNWELVQEERALLATANASHSTSGN